MFNPFMLFFVFSYVMGICVSMAFSFLSYSASIRIVRKKKKMRNEHIVQRKQAYGGQQQERKRKLK